MTNGSSISNPVKLARLTGVLYLVIFFTAGFGEGVVRSGLIVPGDAAATVKQISESEMLFRLGFVSDLLAFVTDLFVTVFLYVLFKPVSKTLSLLAAALRLLAHPAIATVNLLNHHAGVLLLNNSGVIGSFEPGQLNALVSFFLELHSSGYLLAGVFFGIHLMFLGYLLYKSGYFPKVLGYLVLFGGLGYLVESFGMFLFPDYKTIYTGIVMVTAIAGEISLTLWLLVKGLDLKQYPGEAK